MEDNSVHQPNNPLPQLSLKDGKLPEHIDCPFKWDAHNFSPNETSEDIMSRLLEKDEEIINDTDFAWRSFIIQLVLCYELCRQNKLTESIAKIKECEVILKSKAEGCNDIIYKTTTNALWYMTLASKAHLMLESGLFSEAEQALQAIIPEESMDKPNQAGLCGIKAAFLMEYSFGGNKEAVQFAQKAIKIDPKQAEWHFLYGKSTATCRRVYTYYELLDDQELSAMKKAVQIATLNSIKPLRYLIYMANAYRELAFRLYKHNVGDKTYEHSNIAEQVRAYNSKARDIYRTVIKLEINNSRSVTRCCFGLLKLPTYVEDCDLIDWGLEKALAISPTNSMVLHIVGIFFERCKEDFTNALKYYTMAANLRCYGAWLNMIKLLYRSTIDYDPMEEYTKLLNTIRDTPRRHHTLCQIGAYYLFQKKDLLKAVDYCMQVFNENPNSYITKTFKANFVSMHDPIDIMKVLAQEVQFVLKNKLNELDNNYKKKLRQFIIKAACVDSNLLTQQTNLESSVEIILKKAQEIDYRSKRLYHDKRKILCMQKKIARKKTNQKYEKKKIKQKEDNKENKTKTRKLKFSKYYFNKELKRIERKRRRDVATGLSQDVINKIQECKLEKCTYVRGRSLSETRIDYLFEQMSLSSKECLYEKFQEKYFNRNHMLKRSISVDSVSSFNKNKEFKRLKRKSETDCSSDDSQCETALSWRTERGDDRAFRKDKGWKRESSVSSVDSDYENPRRDFNKEFRSKSIEKETEKTDSYLSWRREPGEDRAFGSTNIITGNAVRTDVCSPGDNKSFNTSWSQSGSLNWRTQQSDGVKSLESNARADSVSSLDSEYENYERELVTRMSRLNEVTRSEFEVKNQECYLGNPNKNTHFGSYSTTLNPFNLESVFKTNIQSKEESGKTDWFKNRTEDNEPWTQVSRTRSQSRTRKENNSGKDGKNDEGENQGFGGTPSNNRRSRSYSLSGNPGLFEPNFKINPVNKGKGNVQHMMDQNKNRNVEENIIWKRTDITKDLSNKKDFNKKWSQSGTIEEGTSRRNEQSGRSEQGENQHFVGSSSRDTRTRSYSLSANSGLFEPSFKVNPLNKGKVEKDIMDRNKNKNLEDNKMWKRSDNTEDLNKKWPESGTIEENISKRNEQSGRNVQGENQHFVENSSRGTRTRSYSLSANPNLFEPSLKVNPLNKGKVEKDIMDRNKNKNLEDNKMWKRSDSTKDLNKKWPQSGTIEENTSRRNEQSGRNVQRENQHFVGNSSRETRTRSYSLSANPNLFEPSFKTNANKVKGNEMNVEKQTIGWNQKRTSEDNKTWKRTDSANKNGNTKKWSRPNSENKTSGDITCDNKSDGVKWGNSRWVSDNKTEIKQITSAKAKTQTVIREPYGPEDGKKGFSFIRKSRNL